MAEQNNMRVQSATVDANKGIKGGFDLLSGQWEAKQDITQYRDAAKLDRDRDEHYIKSYLYDWEYYANFSPIWRKRIETHKGIFEGKELKFDNIDLQEKFYLLET
mgnify:CR=1 FL=1